MTVSFIFLSATRKPGFFGFVGTETEVPNDFASRYCFANRNFRLPVAEPQPAKSQTQPAHALFN
jgi:hypothetical protein